MRVTESRSSEQRRLLVMTQKKIKEREGHGIQ
jgi:hypothetical protein